MSDLIDRQAAIDAMWKALYEYEDKTEKQFQESEDLDVSDWIEHRCFVQNMSDIDRQTILKLPSAEPERKKGKWIITSKFEDCYYAKCNQCNITQVFYFNKPLTKFCPNCGANMEGGDKNAIS